MRRHDPAQPRASVTSHSSCMTVRAAGKARGSRIRCAKGRLACGMAGQDLSPVRPWLPDRSGDRACVFFRVYP
ncbi:hypothetical protein IG631_06167 [Alternaria alternata]|nr:hypothetical protein IG631_06167 [Alternaria alternata]